MDGAKRAKGLTVIIDVFRACTTAAYVMNNGAKKIIATGDLKDSFDLKKHNPEYILMGERKGLKVNGFDYGNSPFEIKEVNFSGKTVVLNTTAGTQGIVLAKNADDIILGNFVCANAIVNYIKKQNPNIVYIVAMGNSGNKTIDEDELLAKYLENSLKGKSTNFEKIKEHLKNYKSAKKFFDPNKPDLPEGDFHCALDLDKFNFIMKVSDRNNLEIIKENG